MSDFSIEDNKLKDFHQKIIMDRDVDFDGLLEEDFDGKNPDFSQGQNYFIFFYEILMGKFILT